VLLLKEFSPKVSAKTGSTADVIRSHVRCELFGVEITGAENAIPGPGFASLT
jgi:hypothetical protein